MGASLSWIAIRRKTDSEILAALGLEKTGARSMFAEPPHSYIAFPDDWHIVLSHEESFFTERTPLLMELSAGNELISFSLEEHVMFSVVSGWRSGTKIFEIQVSGAEQGTELDRRYTS